MSDYCTEAEALADIYDEDYAQSNLRRAFIVPSSRNERPIEKMKAQYLANASVNVGDTIKCPFCFKDILKTSYQKQFCNSRHKDCYWNTVDIKIRVRAINFNG